MAKMKNVSLIVEELRKCGESLICISETAAGLFMDTSESSASETQVDPPAEKTLTLEEVRAVLAEKSRLGFTADVRELLKDYGAEKLSAIDPFNYPALVADAEALGNE